MHQQKHRQAISEELLVGLVLSHPTQLLDGLLARYVTAQLRHMVQNVSLLNLLDAIKDDSYR